MLPGSSDGKEDFDVLGPTSWPVESCFLMGARVSLTTHGTLLAFRRTRCTVINASSLGITRIASEYGRRIQWCLYEVARIWRLKAPLGIGWNSLCLTFFLWTLCAVSFPRFCLLYKASWEDHPPHPLALELCRSSKFLFTFLDQKQKRMPPESWALQLRQREWRLKILLFFDRTRKSALFLRLGTVASTDRAKFLIIFQTPTKNVQELAKEEEEESEAKLRGAIEISEGAIPAIADRWRDPWRATS